MASTSSESGSSTFTDKKPGGGAATGGGIDFQAALTTIAGVHVLVGEALKWFPIKDIPLAVWAESEGAGDDIRVELAGGGFVEIQAKKGLQRGIALWDSLETMFKAIQAGCLPYGLLAVAPDASGTVREDLKIDLLRLAQGRTDQLSEIGQELKRRAQIIFGSTPPPYEKVGLYVIHALTMEDAHIQASKTMLHRICADPAQVEAAWNLLYREAVALISLRGRWTLPYLLTRLRRADIVLRDSEFPAAIAGKLIQHVLVRHDGFTIPSQQKQLSLDALIDMDMSDDDTEQIVEETVAQAFDRYYKTAQPSYRQTPTYPAQWAGRFFHHVVVVAGPGLGKSTLTKLLARQYARDGLPVLHIALKQAAQAMALGASFDHALRTHALDGSGITIDQFDHAKLNNLVVLADGLDDCGIQRDQVAAALRDFANGHPGARIIVTTRPVGYARAALQHWRHYRLLPPEPRAAASNIARLLMALTGKDAVDAEHLAVSALAGSRSISTIVSTPHMIGIAATLLAADGKLPATRTALYKQFFSLFESATSQQIPSRFIARRALYILGWQLQMEPLMPVDDLMPKCCRLLAEELGTRQLAAAPQMEAALAYWERAGIIERLHHSNTAYLAFIHKTFGEYAAACYLPDAPGARAEHLARLCDLPDWREVMHFAAGMGLADEIAQFLADRRMMGHQGQLEIALQLACAPGTGMSREQTERIVAIAFDAMAENREDCFSIGSELAKMVRIHTSAVLAVAHLHVDSPHPACRLTAWVCLDTAEPGTRPVAELEQGLLELAAAVKQYDNHGRQLLQALGAAVLRYQEDEQLTACAARLQTLPGMNTYNFDFQVRELLRARGVLAPDDPVKRSFMSPSRPGINAWDLLAPPPAWHRASKAAALCLVNAIDGGEASGVQETPSEFPQFSALLNISGFNTTPVYDIEEWEKYYDATAVRAIVRAMIDASAIDPQALRAEAAAIRLILTADENASFIDLPIPLVDAPEPDWRKATQLITDSSYLDTAAKHGSIWLAEITRKLYQARASS